MKHYPAEALERAAAQVEQPALPLLTEAEVAAELASSIRHRGGIGATARQLGVDQATVLSLIDTGSGIGDLMAARLGYRRVTRFEPID